MRWIMTADLHANTRYPDSLGYCLQVLDDCAWLATRHDTKFILVAGDIFDQKHGVNLDVWLGVYNKLQELRVRGYTVILIPGNHDAPDPANLEFSPLALMQTVSVVTFTPRIIAGGDYCLVMMPWYPGDVYKKILETITTEARKQTGIKILVSHVGILEGKVSMSDSVKTKQPVKAADLYPEVYNGGIFLGDYHAHQRVTDRIMYLGSPIPHTFGDWNNLGVWLYDTQAGAHLLSLPSFYPKFQTWQVTSKADLPLSGYEPRNRNRIYCVLDLMDMVGLAYPTADIKPLEGPIVMSDGRLSTPEEQSPQEIGESWRQLKQLPDAPYKQLIARYLP